MKDHDQNHGDLTLHDIVAHIPGVQKTMRGMEKRLSDRIDGNHKAIQSNASAIKENTSAIQENASAIENLEGTMNRRFDALEEDLYATMSDIVTIRKHVGMSIATDE